MFVTTPCDLRGQAIVFRMPLDNHDSAVCGQARVARQVSQKMAIQRRLRSGYGLEILDWTKEDEHRYQSFLDRVRRRTERRVLVAAAPGRMKELMSALAAVGYSVTGGSQVDSVIHLVGRQQRALDAIVIDSSLDARGLARARLAQMFASSKISCVPADGATPAETRAVVDNLLDVGR